MINKTGITIFRITVSTILLLSLFSSPDRETVSADAAPEPGALASDLYPSDTSTKVRMESETVVINVAKSSEYRDGHAIVTAEFHMRNLGDEREDMLVRFPMNHTYNLQYELENKSDYCSVISWYPPISDFEVWINGQKQYAEITTLTTNNFFADNADELVTLNCWAKFNVVFPPDQEVVIKVKYKVPGYRNGGSDITYRYVLSTGAGWYDTIGSVDIIVSLPYEINEYNFQWSRFERYEISHNEITWHLEDFEPAPLNSGYFNTYKNNFYVELLDPAIWNQILIERENVKVNSTDGEAWGRLGKAYKEAVTESKGYIHHEYEPELFQMGMDANQKSLELLPEDIEWHYGFAELTCMDIMFKDSLHDDYTNQIREICTKQIKFVLDHDPDHEDTLNLLNWVRGMTKSYPEGEIAEYLILTPMPTRTFTPISTNTSTIQPSMTFTALSSFTAAPTKTIIAQASTPTLANDLPEESTSKQNRLLFAVIANILVLTLFFLVTRSAQPRK